MKKFEIGETYSSNFLGDHELHGLYTCTKRTEKTVTFVDESGRKITRRNAENSNGEYVRIGSGEFLHA